MTTLYTNNQLVSLTVAEFNSYTEIRISEFSGLTGLAKLQLLDGGVVDFVAKLGSLAAQIDGSAQADAIRSGSAEDTVSGGAGSDTLDGSGGNDILLGDWSSDVLFGNDLLLGGEGNDYLVGGRGDDILFGGNGNDSFGFDGNLPGNDSYDGGDGIDGVFISSSLSRVSLNRLILNAAASVEYFWSQAAEHALTGTQGDDQINLTGTTAQTFVFGQWINRVSFDLLGGSDSYLGGVSEDVVTVSSGGDLVDLGAGNDRLIVIDGVFAGDNLGGGAGFDWLCLGDPASLGLPVPKVVALSTLDSVGAASFEGLAVYRDTLLVGTAESNIFDLSALSCEGFSKAVLMLDGNDRFVANANFGISVDGGLGNDTLIGGLLGDTLAGGAGNDSLVGGEGGDTYVIGSLGDVMVETGLSAGDTVQTSLRSYTLADNIELLIAIGKGGLNGIGNASGNLMTGAEGRDSLSGQGGNDTLTGAGRDTLVGGTGDDIYFVNASTVTIREQVGQGSDTLYTAAATWTLAGNLENLVNTGRGNFSGTGSRGDNMLTGGAGKDILQGLGGNDIYVINGWQDQVIETKGNGFDTVRTNVSNYMLPDFVEGLELFSKGTGTLKGSGNELNNVMEGSANQDILFGLAGNDTMKGDISTRIDTLVGGIGDDLYLVDSLFSTSGAFPLGDVIREKSGEGTDTVISKARSTSIFTLENVENVESQYAGNAVAEGNWLDNLITTQGGDDVLNGWGGHDTLVGGAGADQFQFAAADFERFRAESSDTILDFVAGEDKILIRAHSFGRVAFSTSLDRQDFKVISGGGVQDSSDSFLYDQTTGELFYDEDRLGINAPFLFAVLDNHALLKATDFLFY